MSSFDNGESSGIELPVEVIYQHRSRVNEEKKKQPNLENSRVTVSKEQGGILNLIPVL